MDAVGADQDVGRDGRATLEPGLDTVALVVEPDQTAAEMDAIGGETRRDDGEQVGAVNRQVRRAIELFAAWIERGPLERPPVAPASLVGADRPHRLAIERSAEAEPIQDTHRVGSHVDAATDLGQLRRLLVY